MLKKEKEKQKQAENLRIDFLRVFANIPINIRREVILVFRDEPVSWSVVYLEVSQKTEVGDEMVVKLKRLEFI